jgi:hypothetical protein
MAFYQPSKDLRVFGKRLTAHRDSQGLSRMALAGSVNVSQEHIWRLKNVVDAGRTPANDQERRTLREPAHTEIW